MQSLTGFLRRLIDVRPGEVAALRNREIFTLAVVFTCVGAAWITSMAGLSLALGAFLAGLVLSESEYGLQALSDILPFRDTFSGLFFTSMGMLLDVQVVLERPAVIVGAALTIVVVKSLIVVGVIRWLKRSLRVGVIVSDTRKVAAGSTPTTWATPVNREASRCGWMGAPAGVRVTATTGSRRSPDSRKATYCATW